jgi:predicted nucleotide-binding protein
VGGNVIASRAAGEHVGEMAGLLRSRRTATVVSREETVLARVGLDEFLKIAESRPDLLKNLATTLAFRLNQRRNLLREPNLRPFIFIGSSKKHVPVANRIRDGLRALGVEIQVWSDAGAFPASSTFIETLTAGARQADFAVFIFGKDDTMISKGKKTFVPRDNVIFETGLFIGAIGRNRTFPVRQKNADIKVLSDLQGVTLLDFKKTKGQIDVSSACDQIAARVKKLWVR